jgi:hypothetical protein
MYIDVYYLPGEIFKAVKDDSRYAVSNLGRVYAFRRERVRGGIVQQYNNGYGYPVVNISNKTRTVHRLMMEAFIPNRRHLPVINHIDCNKRNNRLTNLEWSSYAHNNRHARKYGLNKGKMFCVFCLDFEHRLVKKYARIADVIMDGFNPSCVVQCAKGKRNTHGGRLWEYA